MILHLILTSVLKELWLNFYKPILVTLAYDL